MTQLRVDAHTDAQTLSAVAKPSYERVPSARLWSFVESTSVKCLFSMTLLHGLPELHAHERARQAGAVRALR